MNEQKQGYIVPDEFEPQISSDKDYKEFEKAAKEFYKWFEKRCSFLNSITIDSTGVRLNFTIISIPENYLGLR